MNNITCLFNDYHFSILSLFVLIFPSMQSSNDYLGEMMKHADYKYFLAMVQSIAIYSLFQGCNYYSCSCQLKLCILMEESDFKVVLIPKFCHGYWFNWHLNYHSMLQTYTNPCISLPKSLKMQVQKEKNLSEV